MVSDPRSLLARRVYYGWFVMVACFIAALVVFGTSYAFSVFYDAFIREFETSRALLALVFGLQTALIYSPAVLAGRFVTRYGQRRVSVASSFVLTVGLVWTAFARSYLELLAAFGIITSLGMAGLFIVSYATLPQWFERRRGTATGIAASGLGVGVIVVPPAANAIITTLGWRTAMLAVAGVVALLSLVVILLMADDPADVDAVPSVEFDDYDPQTPDAGLDTSKHVRSVVFSGSYALVFAGWLLIWIPIYVILSHLVLHAVAAGVGRSTGVFAVATIGVTTTIARVGIGRLSDLLGRVRTFVACGVIVASGATALAFAPNATLFVTSVVLFAAGYSGCGGLFPAIAADMFGRQSFNTLFGLLSISFAISGLVAPPLAGLWFEYVGSYTPALVAAGVAGLVGAGCVAFGARINTDSQIDSTGSSVDL